MRGNAVLTGYIYPLEYIKNRKLEMEIDKETEDYFDDTEEESYEVCSHFGCGKRLRLEEILAGGRCCKHSKIKNYDSSRF